jgi:iron complex transport system permease protein
MNVSRAVTAGRSLRVTATYALFALACALLSLRIGSFSISFGEMMPLLLSGESPESETFRAVLLDIRIPRILAAMFVGGGLAVAGVVFQVLLRNVLADPYILGVSSGAAVGALLAIATGISALFLAAQPLLAFGTALLVVAAVYRLGLRGAQESNTLLLSGVMIGAFLSAIILGLVSTMDRPIRTALFWLVGYLGNSGMPEILVVAPGVTVLTTIVFFLAGRMNVLALGADAAAHLGLPVRRMQAGLYVAASLLTAMVVSIAGAIGFIGLLVPHVVRKLHGPDHRILLPVSFFLGAAFLIISDLIARTILSPNELPVGAVTAALGAPLFIYLLRGRRDERS